MTTPTDAAAKAREAIGAVTQEWYASGTTAVLTQEEKANLETPLVQALLAYGDERAREAREKALEIVETFNVADAGFSAQEMLAALGERIRALKGKS
jgi:hypothetical protein